MEITRNFVSLLESRVQEKLNFIQIVVGPRQVGKTTGVTQLLDRWSGPKVFATADLPAPPQPEWISEQWNQATSYQDETLLVLDEVQKVPRWSEVIKAHFDRGRAERRLRVILLGSASLAIEEGLTESLAGRFELIKVAHWSFTECRDAYAWELNDYLKFGGYPAAAELTGNPERWQQFLRSSIIEPLLSRDIFGLASIRKPALFRQVFELACHFPAQEVSYQKLLGQLQDRGNVTTIKSYLEILERAFVLKLIPKFSKNIIRQKSSSPKVLPLCPALVHAFTSPSRTDTDPQWRGRLVELVVGAELLRRYDKVSYWRQGRAEVDFIVESEQQLFAVEVKSGAQRRQSGVGAFLKEYPAAIPRQINSTNCQQFLSGEDLRTL